MKRGVVALVVLMCALSAGSAYAARGNLRALSCPTSKLCYAVGGLRIGGVFDTIKHGRQTKSQTLRGTQGLFAIDCPTKNFCGILGNSGDGLSAVVLTLSHGTLSAPVRLSWTPTQISCPSAGKCVLAGNSGSSLAAAVFSGGTPGTPSVNSASGLTVDSLSCVSMSACEMAGDSFYAGVAAHAQIGAVHKKSGHMKLQGGVACARKSNTCYLTAGSQKKGALFSVKIGGSKLTRVSTSKAIPDRISCRTLRHCSADAFTTRSVPAIVSYTKGRPVAERNFKLLGMEQAFFTDVARLSATRWIALATTNLSTTTDIFVGKG